MASLSERVLGKRIINYLKNEALVGRISQKKLQVPETKTEPEFLFTSRN
jgi:hypothetical protein